MSLAAEDRRRGRRSSYAGNSPDTMGSVSEDHHELPDCNEPYKRYESECIEQAVDDR